MLDLLLLEEMRPFTIAFGIVTGLLALEIIFAFLGFTSSIGGDGAAEIDGPDFDAPDLDGPDIDGPEIDGLEIDGLEVDGDADLDGDLAGAATDLGDASDAAGMGPLGAAASWLGLTKAPITIWFAGLLTFFGIGGYAVQSAAIGLFGSGLPAGLVAAAVFVPSVLVARRFARAIGWIVPRFESTAISQRSFDGRRGIVTVGTASEGNPAQVRFTDGHGNMHYLMAEPLKSEDVIPEGAEVAIMRTRSGEARILQLG